MIRGSHWLYTGKGYVTTDGNYGGDSLIVFEHNALTQEQWDKLGELSDYDRINYVEAVLSKSDLSDWE
jgi:hypothetical protein